MRTMYYDGLRGPIAVKPVAIVHPGQIELRVTAKEDNARPYNTGDVLRVPRRSLVYVLSGQRCVTVPDQDIHNALN